MTSAHNCGEYKHEEDEGDEGATHDPACQPPFPPFCVSFDGVKIDSFVLLLELFCLGLGGGIVWQLRFGGWASRGGSLSLTPGGRGLGRGGSWLALLALCVDDFEEDHVRLWLDAAQSDEIEGLRQPFFWCRGKGVDDGVRMKETQGEGGNGCPWERLLRTQPRQATRCQLDL